MHIIYREMKPCEYPLLKDFLYEAIFILPNETPPPKNIIEAPELQLYIDKFGHSPHDHSFVAEVDGNIVGAVWTRIMNDYGHVDEHTPSFAISLYKEYRGLGIGSELMKRMLSTLQSAGYQKASLSVQKKNYAASMYQRLGFEIIDENEEEYIMIIQL